MTPEQQSIWHIGTAFLLLLLLLACRMIYWQIVNEPAFQPTARPTIAAGTGGHAGGRASIPGRGTTPGLIVPVRDPAPHAPGLAQQPPGSAATPATPTIEPAAVQQSTW